MAQTYSYKQYTRGQRKMVSEELFNKGMMVTDVPLDEGYAKSVVNYDLSNNGKSLVTRGGLREIKRLGYTTLDSNSNSPANWISQPNVFFTGDILITEDTTKDKTIIVKCTVLEGIAINKNNNMLANDPLRKNDYDRYMFNSFAFDEGGREVIIELDGTLIEVAEATNTQTKEYLTATQRNSQTSVFHDFTNAMVRGTDMSVALPNMHGWEMESPSAGGMYALLNNNMYCIVGYPTDFLNIDALHTITKTAVLATLEIWKVGNSWVHAYIPVAPKKVLPSQVVNYGYNMLLDEPYKFEIEYLDDGLDLRLDGIVPVDAKGNTILNAKTGESITFKLIARTTIQHSNANGGYCIQWEVKDLSTSSNAEVIQDVRELKDLFGGENITFKPAYKQFALICKVFSRNAVDALTYVSHEDDMKKLTPLESITLASYRLTDDIDVGNVDLKKYIIPTARGMCEWKQRIVFWSVRGAESSIFITEAADPSWVPYPNGAESFDGNVVACVPYLDNLLVFTERKLYSLTFSETGLDYTSKVIQNNINLSLGDAYTICPVNNMIYFKSGTRFFMVVPKSNSMSGELQLAPVSKPIDYMFDTFESSVNSILDDTYNLGDIFGTDTSPEDYFEYDGVWVSDNSRVQDNYNVSLYDYHNFAVAGTVYNVYKLKITINKDGYWALYPNSTETDIERDEQGRALYKKSYNYKRTMFVDFTLRYDSVLRAWTSYIRHSTISRVEPYNISIAEGTQYCGIFKNYKQEYSWDWIFSILSISSDSCIDDMPPNTYQIPILQNNQLLDTGYRRIEAQVKKRFRELQFSIINNTEAQLKFHTSFTVDNDERKSMYKYNVQHITDVASPDYGLVYVERVMTDEYLTESTTALAPAEDGNHWVLDMSSFPNATVAKIRHTVSGKGYTGRMKILSVNQVKYELVNTNWVYRSMYAR